MSQDTRKDRRVKIVSLNVRYKSATVDEFIENHAHDVSKGGIYIKTANPFPSGTLLKFEIRLSSDQAVITGVGRVVWKRDAPQANGDRPAGMGVKFIKIDDPSKTVIDKLVSTRSDAGRAYEAEAEAPPAGSQHPPPVAAPAARPPAPAIAARPSPNPPALARKATMMGVGSAPPPGQVAGAPRIISPPPFPPRPGGAPDMFPKGSSPPAGPKPEQTVMKQAAELLEEALREAGGSMEEVGTNPLFSGGSGGGDAPAGSANAWAKNEATAAPKLDDGTSSPPGHAQSVEETKTRAMVAGMSPAPAPETKLSSDPPRTARETPGARGGAQAKTVSTRFSSKPPAARAADALAAHKGAKKGSGRAVALLIAVAAAAIAGVMYRDKLFGGGSAPTPAPSPTISQTAASTPLPATAEPAASASAAATEAPSASASASASASGAPMPAASASGAAASASASASAPANTAPATAPKPTVTATATATPTATHIPTAAPAPKPKPQPKPSDDNPY